MENAKFMIRRPSVEIISNADQDEALRIIERVGRICYQSQDKITDGSAERFLRARLYKDHHDTLIEHYSVTVVFNCDRGVANEIVRHRIASYAQASTRYCNYSKDKYGNQISCVAPPFKNESSEVLWEDICNSVQDTYMRLIENGETPELARSVLPLSLHTEIAMTANLREWRHFLAQRTSKAAHPQIREIASELLRQFKDKLPIFFEDFDINY